MENKHFNEKAYFGQFGGQFVPETAMFALSELETEYEKLKNDKEFFQEFDNLLKNYNYFTNTVPFKYQTFNKF